MPIKSLHIFDDDCVSSVTWSIVAETASQAWNCIWCLNVMYDLMFPINDSSRFMNFYHLWAWSCTAAMTTAILVLDQYGGVEYGDYVYCGIPNSTFSTLSSSIEFFFTIFCLIWAMVSLAYTWRRLGTLHDKDAIHMLWIHSAYVLVFIILWLGQRTASMIHSSSLFHQIVSLLWQAQAFFVCIIRLQEPLIVPALLMSLGLSGIVHRFWPKLNPNALTERLLTDEDMSMLVEMPQSASGHGGSHSVWGVSNMLRAELEVTDSLGMPAQSNSVSVAHTTRRTAAGDL